MSLAHIFKEKEIAAEKKKSYAFVNRMSQTLLIKYLSNQARVLKC